MFGSLHPYLHTLTVFLLNLPLITSTVGIFKTNIHSKLHISTCNISTVLLIWKLQTVYEQPPLSYFLLYNKITSKEVLYFPTITMQDYITYEMPVSLQTHKFVRSPKCITECRKLKITMYGISYSDILRVQRFVKIGQLFQK